MPSSFLNQGFMMFKVVVLVVFLAVLLTLGFGFFFLIKEGGQPKKIRLLKSLWLRVSLALILLVLLAIGLSTGQLGH